MKKTVLFVDDEPHLQEVLVAVLEAEGINCVYLRNATDAIEYIENNDVSVLVTDIMMPAGPYFSNVDSSECGFVFVTEVRRRFPNISIICLSVIGDQKKINSLKKKKVLYLRKGETPLETAIKLIKSKVTGTITY